MGDFENQSRKFNIHIDIQKENKLVREEIIKELIMQDHLL